MKKKGLNILRLDARRDDIQTGLRSVREKLSPRGDVVSQEGRRRTLEVFGEALTPQEVVERICSDVRQRGLPALLHYGAQLDGASPQADAIRVRQEQIDQAHEQADPEFLAAVRRIRDNILDFQRAILHRDVTIARPHGAVLRQRYTPLTRVGLCIPGGAAAYPSTVLMTAGPALAAGVPEIAVVAPPTPFGADNPDVLAVCREIGIQEIYRVGGAQAVAALAYGVDGIPKVDKIAGPGNLFVALAKKHVYGEVDIDSIAGPSEVVIVADETTRADFAAADLLAQAEHAPGASIFISWRWELLDRTIAQLEHQLAPLSRRELAAQSLEAFGAMILARDEEQACEIADYLAPEHLHIACENAERLLPKIRHAGAVFLGNYSPVALGDYAAGPSHVLPTSGTARWASGLTANDFLRSASVIAYSEQALRDVAADIQLMAEKEGLTAHRSSVDVRIGEPPDPPRPD